MSILLIVCAWIALSIPIAMLVGKVIAVMNGEPDQLLPPPGDAVANQFYPPARDTVARANLTERIAGFDVAPTGKSGRWEQRLARDVANAEHTRAVHYREQADQLRGMAQAESIARLRDNLLSLAEQYDRLAASAEPQERLNS